ncbi:hypothetical protein Mal52_49220 [Symmachiella dynata]|uniref:Uncharacterized protein n=1 Tax=Symmachiella dynata TaxID=2527995 RepID=A0A517ZV87_9PLAN|nr:hypothetical protein Mal52_49220 [Symmachiella dynata]
MPHRSYHVVSQIAETLPCDMVNNHGQFHPTGCHGLFTNLLGKSAIKRRAEDQQPDNHRRNRQDEHGRSGHVLGGFC